MPTLVVINGPPGVGKTTVGWALAELRAPALRLDVDEIRDLIVGWEEDPTASGARARTMVVEMAAFFLRSGGDVVVSQLYGRTPDLERLETMAADAGAAFVEVVLTAERDEVRRRFIDRGGPKVDDLDAFDTLYDRVVEMLATRAGALKVRSIAGDPEGTASAVAAAIL